MFVRNRRSRRSGSSWKRRGYAGKKTSDESGADSGECGIEQPFVLSGSFASNQPRDIGWSFRRRPAMARQAVLPAWFHCVFGFHVNPSDGLYIEADTLVPLLG